MIGVRREVLVLDTLILPPRRGAVADLLALVIKF
jgi:hypothetical protein